MHIIATLERENEYRKRRIAVFERPGSRIYFAEADTAVGPSVYAKKVAGFEHYTFYWPGQLPYLDKKGGRTIYFAGTYTDAFSSAPLLRGSGHPVSSPGA